MKVDIRPTTTESMALDGVNAEPFGIALTYGATVGTAKPPSSLSDQFLGVAQHTQSYFNSDLSGSAGIPAGGQINLVRKGLIWVKVENAVTDGGAVYMRVTANGGNTQLGAFRSDVDNNGTADTAVLCKGAVFRSAAKRRRARTARDQPASHHTGLTT